MGATPSAPASTPHTSTPAPAAAPTVISEALRNAFERFDVDGSGTLSRDEFIAVVTREKSTACPPRLRAEVLGEEDADALFDMFDQNQDGRISIEEFCVAMAMTGADATAANEAGSRLHYACARGAPLQVVAQYLDEGDGVDAISDDGFTPLYEACFHGQLGIARLLLDRGADVHELSDNGKTALRGAVGGGNGAVVSLLLERGADPSQADDRDISPLYLAAQRPHLEAMAALLEGGAAVDQVTALTGGWALRWACSMGHLQSARLLLDARADVNKQSEEDGSTSLGVASEGAHVPPPPRVPATARLAVSQSSDRAPCGARACRRARADRGAPARLRRRRRPAEA